MTETTKSEVDIDKLEVELVSSLENWQKAASENRDADATEYGKQTEKAIKTALEMNWIVKLPLTTLRIETEDPVLVLKAARHLSKVEGAKYATTSVGGSINTEERTHLDILSGRGSFLVADKNMTRLFSFTIADIDTSGVKIR